LVLRLALVKPSGEIEGSLEPETETCAVQTPVST
jgi:hypothetical protein